MSDPSIDSVPAVIDSDEAAPSSPETTPEPAAKSIDEELAALTEESSLPEEDQTPEEGATEPEAQEDEPEEVEEEVAPVMRAFDFGGDKFEVEEGSIAPELADRLDKFTRGTWSKFTKDQQANTDTAKSLKAREKSLGQLERLEGEALQSYSTGIQLKQEIEQLRAVDVNQLWQSNPDQARQISDRLQSKQAQFQQVVSQVGQHEQQMKQAQAAEVKRISDEGKAALDRKYKGFSDKIAPDIMDYAVSQGMAKEDAGTWSSNPLMAEMTYKAMMYDKQQAAATANQIKPKEARPVKAMKSKGAASSGVIAPEQMDINQLAKQLGLG